MMMRKFGIRLLAAIAASSLIVTPVLAAPSVDELEKDKAAAQSEVESLQQQLTATLEKLDELETNLIAKGEEITQAEEDLKKAEEKEQQQYDDMKLRIKYMYEQGNTSAVEALITAEDFTSLVNNAEYVQNVYSYDRDKLEEYVETKKEVETLKTTLEEEQKNLQSMQSEYEAEEESLNATIEAKQDEIADLDVQLQEAAEAAAAARRAAEEAAAREAEESSNSGASGSGNSSGSSSSGGGYVSSGDTSAAQTIVNAAYSQLGVPYKWGGTSPGSALDCSGLVQYCHSVAGISIGRTSGAQGGGGQAISNPQPGDVVCYSGHVGIYIGGGQMIHAPQTGDVVKVASVTSVNRAHWYRRYW